MKKTLMIAAVLATAFTQNVVAGDLDQWRLPANSVWNDSAQSIGAPIWIQHVFKIDVEQAVRAVIGTAIDPRGYPDSAYPGGKRPSMNVQLGNMGTGKCYSDPKGNGIYCP
jgi:hypothetical protein